MIPKSTPLFPFASLAQYKFHLMLFLENRILTYMKGYIYIILSAFSHKENSTYKLQIRGRQASGNPFLEKMLLQKSYILPSYNFILDFLARKSSEDSAIDLCTLNKLTSEYCLPITLVIPFFLEFILVA